MLRDFLLVFIIAICCVIFYWFNCHMLALSLCIAYRVLCSEIRFLEGHLQCSVIFVQHRSIFYVLIRMDTRKTVKFKVACDVLRFEEIGRADEC